MHMKLTPAVLLMLLPTPMRADLPEYLQKAEPKFAWKLNSKSEQALGTVYDLHLVSQTWHDITWEHDLQVFVPKKVEPGATMLLWNTGGKPSVENTFLGLTIAAKAKTPVAFLFGIPNQPLLGGKKEDGLIAETFVRCLDSKDESWPLLFPMTKSLVKAMDALEQFAKQEWKLELKSFVVSGASKRGWTTWLTGASDARVKAIVPMVIDTLNIDAQMPHQLDCFGEYSEQIKDYTQRGLVPCPDTKEAKKLWAMVDPWRYREKLTLPKLIVNGTNDPYWALDALNLYWNDLKGDKWVLYVPNAGHGLEQQYEDGNADRLRAVNALAAFVYHEAHDKTLPKLEWKHEAKDNELCVNAECKPAPAGARLWVAEASTRDFRKAQWKEEKVALKDGKLSGSVAVPKKDFRAYYAEMDFEVDGLKYQLSTQLKIVGDK